MSSSMEPRPLTSAMESPTFEEDSSFHVEQPVGSMSISPCGRDVVLASKEGLHVIDLDSPYSPPRYLPHHTPWEVADVQWSPFAARDQWVVSTSNQKALVWNLAMKTWQNSIEIVLHAHTRAITDINFSAFHPDILATCSVDSFVHCWDLRAPSRPAVSFSDWFTGATQVKWNRQDPHVIASSHDRFLRIWDDRMGAYPIKSIEAHSTKIYGVDWNRVRRGGLVTCSLDRTIKFWDYTTDSDSDVPEKQIHTPFPVWRARNTPFGWGMLAMPQRGNNDLHLYSRRAGEDSNPEDDLPLVHTFPGHKGQVKEFLWRPRGGVADGIDHREYQLVTWGADRELRLHKVNPEILARVGYEKGRSFISTRTVTRLGAVYRSFRDVNSDLDIDDVDVTSSAGQQNQNTAAGTGMNAITVPHARGWIKGGHHVDRFGMQPRSNLRADTNPIAWMRGVKISGWDIETLGDEISQVGEKFTKVAFDSVDVRQRKISISLNGPWGADGASLFLKVDIKFPTSYPKTAIPTFAFQKTAAVTDEWAAKTTAELRTIAETYMSRNRGCLEGAVRYLLGESSLEDSIAWILGETGDNLKSPINGELEGESSDEDEVGMTQSQELGMSSELLRPVNANVMVPVAKVCGALWANDGRLICFFPPKPKKDKSAELFENMGFKEMTRWSRGDKVFQGFGRLHTNSPGPRGTGTITSTDDGDSDDSDESYSDTSSSSGSSDVISGLPTRFPAPRTWRSAGSYGLHRPRSTDNSQRSTAGGATVKSEAPQNIVSIHNLSDMLPVKRELASQYRICGKGTDVCAHNAAVALDAGCYELAQIWGLIKLILHAGKSAGTLPESGLLQRRTHKKGGGSGGLGKGGVYRGLTGSIIRWGDHPLGSHWLVPALFEHFERIGDIQMVAMLSCVLLEANQEGYLENQQAKKTPGKQDFSLDFSPVPSAIPTKPPAATPGSSVLKEVQAAPETSARSSSETWRLDSTPPYSTGTTPPVMSRPRGIAADRKNPSHSVSMAASPDQQSQVRSGSGFGSVLASSLSRSFTFGPSSASPPTSRMDKKKPTPQNSPSVATGQASQAQSETESNHTPEPTPPPARFKVTFKNQNAFESDGPAQDSFLDTDEELLYRSYRIAYANLLSIWDLPVQQSEVMKIGAVADRVDDLTSSHYWNSTISKETDLKDPQPEPTSQALDFQRHCASCGHALQLSIFNKQPIAPNTPSKRHQRKPSGRRCPNCKPRQPLPTKLPCVICGEVVDGMLIPCLSCGHVSCFDCHRHWFLRPADKFDSPFDHPDQKSFLPTCPTGCGCQCSEHIAVDVPMPVLEPVSHGPKDYASVTPHSIVKAKHSHRRQSEPVGLGTTRKEAQAPQPKGVGQSEHDLDAWHDSSPFASLARGLGGGLSRGLQTKEARKKNKSVAVASNLRNS